MRTKGGDKGRKKKPPTKLKQKINQTTEYWNNYIQEQIIYFSMQMPLCSHTVIPVAVIIIATTFCHRDCQI